ncbi:anhydro-N-acetylmuramic acid kinase, partial [Rhizobium ruizarguesonis]
SHPLSDRSERPSELHDIELELTLRHATAVTAFMERFGLSAAGVDVLGFHGQTVLHRPDEGLTIQIGDGQELAKRTGISVVYDMPAMDHVVGAH